MANKATASSDAGRAARGAFLAGEHTLPGVPGVILGGAMAAATFAAMMAFETGGIVPGVGKGDIVPAKLEPGEASSVTRSWMGCAPWPRVMARAAGESHYHYNPTIHIQALDRDGMDEVLTKHADTVKKHFMNHARRINQ